MNKKLFLYLALLLLNISCVTNYYTVLLEQDTPIYVKSNETSEVKTTIPKGTQVYLATTSSKKTYKKIKWGNYYGWANNPTYSLYSNYEKTSNSNSSSYSSGSSYNSSSSGGSVQVKGYYRKDGTYVKPHTRSAPRRR